MNRRIKRISNRIQFLIDHIFTHRSSNPQCSAFGLLIQNQNHCSWLIDDHRARTARHFLDHPETFLDDRFPKQAVLDCGTNECWVEGTPHTHNQSLQTWRDNYIKRVIKLSTL